MSALAQDSYKFKNFFVSTLKGILENNLVLAITFT